VSVGRNDPLYTHASCRDTLREIIAMLETSNHPQVDYITRVMRKWAKENKIDYV
jgi:hypothetical protein